MQVLLRVLMVVGVIAATGASTAVYAGEGASINFSVRFWNLHFAEKPAPLVAPQAVSTVAGSCGDIHAVNWSCAPAAYEAGCPSADRAMCANAARAEVEGYRKDLEHRWRELDALMTRFQNWPQRYDRYDFDYMVSQFGLDQSQMHERLARKVRGTRRLVIWYEHNKYGS